MKGNVSILMLVLVFMLACTCHLGSTVPTPTPAPEAPNTFSLSVLVDLNSEPVTREQAQMIVDEASGILSGLTGFKMKMIDFQEISSGGTTHAMVQEYVKSTSAVLPNGVILFSFGDDGMAKMYGGYSFTVPGPTGYVNRFISPYGQESDLYVGVIHFGHRFARCGYDDSETKVSDVSIDGECRNQPGTTCVEKFGYSMCSNAVDDLYASTPTYMASSSFVHEIMHPFGPHGNEDHYFTPECTAAMRSGISTRPYHADTFDLDESSFYVSMCPFVFDNFVKSYRR